MNKKSKILTTIIIINIIISLSMSMFFTATNAVSQKLETQVESIEESKYPGIKEKIAQLKKTHPKWEFKILYTGIEWKDAISNEYTGHGKSPKNLVPVGSNYAGEWICGICGNKAYDSGSWRCASEKAIQYMMDPRNSLNETDLFQFLELSYGKGTNYSKDIVKQMLKGSFIAEDKYASSIMEACQTYGVSPYYIVARILQEQGKSGSVLTKGQGYNGQYAGYYNIFNIGASGSNKEKVILNGLAKAKNNNWTSLEASIKGGVEVIAQQYIGRGQYTLYFQKFDVENTDGNLYWHQYMQNILAAQNEGNTLRKTYVNMGAIEDNFTFVIPVYENMPKQVSSRPNTTVSTQYELVKINVTSTLRMRNAPNGSTTVGYLHSGEIAKRLEKATEKVNGTYWDKILKDDGTIGYVARTTYDYEKEYKLYLVPVEEENNNKTTEQEQNNNNNTQNEENNNQSENNTEQKEEMNSTAKVHINTENNTLATVPNATVKDIKEAIKNAKVTDNAGNILSDDAKVGTGTKVNEKYTIIKKGDSNGDGNINSADLLAVQKHLLNVNNIKNTSYGTAADVNNDGEINSADLLGIQKHLLGVAEIQI